MRAVSSSEYAVLYLGPGGVRVSAAGGGNVILNAGQHALGGAEHTGQLPAARVSVADAADYYAGAEAEAVLAEIGAELAVLSAGSASLVPYLIGASETFTVPVTRQALFTVPITILAGGTLSVAGYLVEVH